MAFDSPSSSFSAVVQSCAFSDANVSNFMLLNIPLFICSKIYKSPFLSANIAIKSDKTLLLFRKVPFLAKKLKSFSC